MAYDLDHDVRAKHVDRTVIDSRSDVVNVFYRDFGDRVFSVQTLSQLKTP